MDEVNQELANQSKPQTPHTGQVTEFIPTSKFHKFRITGLIGLLFLTAVSAAYMFSQNQSLKSQVGSTQTCVYEDRVYQIGEQVPLIDSCKSCSCDTNGLVACNDTACEQESETINQTTGNVPENLLLYYSFTPPPDFPLEHTKTGMTENDELYYSSKYKSLNIILEQGWRNGFGCAVQEKSEQIHLVGRELAKETWIGVPADYPDENATALCDINGGVGFRGIIIRLVEHTDQKWGHNLVVTHDTKDISSAKVDQLLEQILSTFEFIDQNIKTSEEVSTLPSETIEYSPKSDWQTYTDKIAGFSIQYGPDSEVNSEATEKGKRVSVYGCVYSKDIQGGDLCLHGYGIDVRSNYEGGSADKWLRDNFEIVGPVYYMDWIVDGKKALVAIENNPGGSSSGFVAIPNDNKMFVYVMPGVSWDSDTGQLPDLSGHKSILSTFKTIK